MSLHTKHYTIVDNEKCKMKNENEFACYFFITHEFFNSLTKKRKKKKIQGKKEKRGRTSTDPTHVHYIYVHLEYFFSSLLAPIVLSLHSHQFPLKHFPTKQLRPMNKKQNVMMKE